MSLRTRALLYQLACFAVLFLVFRLIIDMYTGLTGIWVPLTAFVIGTILSPKFKVVRTQSGDRLFYSWIFIKGVREIK